MELNYVIKKTALILVILICLIASAGHLTKHYEWASLGEGHVTMKVITSLLLILCSILIIKSSKVISTIICITSLYVFLSWKFNQIPVSFLPWFEPEIAFDSLRGDVPSWLTLISASAFALTVWVKSINQKVWIYKAVILQGVIALLGHVLNVHQMYFEFEAISTGEAPNTAMCFILLGMTKLTTDLKK